MDVQTVLAGKLYFLLFFLFFVIDVWNATECPQQMGGFEDLTFTALKERGSGQELPIVIAMNLKSY